jgi:hypothetical protein
MSRSDNLVILSHIRQYGLEGSDITQDDPSFRDVAKGWESSLLADEILALASSSVCLGLVGAVGIESNEKLYLKDLRGMRW